MDTEFNSSSASRITDSSPVLVKEELSGSVHAMINTTIQNAAANSRRINFRGKDIQIPPKLRSGDPYIPYPYTVIGFKIYHRDKGACFFRAGVTDLLVK
jgi:hypothetical protein